MNKITAVLCWNSFVRANYIIVPGKVNKNFKLVLNVMRPDLVESLLLTNLLCTRISRTHEILLLIFITDQQSLSQTKPEVRKLKFILKLKIKCNDWLLADTCPQAANHCTLF